MIALDASALLAFLFRKKGHEVVAGVIGECCLSTVNLSEVIARFVRDGHDAREVMQRLTASPIEIVPFTAEDAVRTAALYPHTLCLGLSLGDRACIALASYAAFPRSRRIMPGWISDCPSRSGWSGDGCKEP